MQLMQMLSSYSTRLLIERSESAQSLVHIGLLTVPDCLEHPLAHIFVLVVAQSRQIEHRQRLLPRLLLQALARATRHLHGEVLWIVEVRIPGRDWLKV